MGPSTELFIAGTSRNPVTFTGVPQGRVDLVATRMTEAGSPPDRVLLMRDLDVTLADVTRPYVARFHEAADEIWVRRDSEQAQEFLVAGYPMHHVSAETLALTDAWLARDDHPAPARRLMAEGRDSVVRALRARERDAAAAAG